jgi:hypothetical protein
MEDLTVLVNEFFETQAGQLALLVVLLPVVDWLSGVAAAFRDGTFELDAVAAILGKHASRVLGIWTLLIFGWITDEWLIPVVDIPTLSAIGVAAAGAYALETVGSIARSWGPAQGPALLTRYPVQPTPQD